MTTNSSASKRLIAIIVIMTVVFCVSTMFDIFPGLRGPIDHLLPSRWPYYPTPINLKVFVPIVIILTCVFLLPVLQASKSKKIIFLTTWTISLLLQLALIFSSSFGLGVIFRRIADPDINGYFSTAVKYPNSLKLFQSFPSLNTSLDQHAKSHPPGLVSLISIIVTNAPPAPKNSIDNPIWQTLSPSQQSASLITAIALFATTATLPFLLYLLTAKLFSHQAGVLASLITILVPSVNFFSLLADPAYAIFPILSLYFLLSKTKKTILLSGVISAASLFFTISSIVTTTILMLNLLTNRTGRKFLILFMTSFVLIYTLPLFLNINPLAINFAALTAQFPREYLIWVIHNPIDAGIFLGVPISLLFISATSTTLRQKKWTGSKQLLVLFLFVMSLVIFSGSNRGEAGRVWVSFMPLPIAYAAHHLSSHKSCVGIATLLLLGLQLLTINYYWVPAW